MIYLRYDDLLVIAARVIGSQPLVRDAGLLEAAAFRPQAAVFGTDAYPTIPDKAAALMESLARSHPLVDGNKRLALGAVIVFLGMNGLRLRVSNDEAYNFTMDVATGTIPNIDEIADRLRRMTGPRD